MGFWINNPSTGKDDTMLTCAVSGFVLSAILAVGQFVASLYIPKVSMGDIAMVIGAILTPTVAAYTARRYTDVKYSNGNGNGNGNGHSTLEKPDQPESGK